MSLIIQWLSMYICVYIYNHIHIIIYIYICNHIYIYIYICIHIYIYIHMYTYIHRYIRVQSYFKKSYPYIIYILVRWWTSTNLSMSHFMATVTSTPFGCGSCQALPELKMEPQTLSLEDDFTIIYHMAELEVPTQFYELKPFSTWSCY